MGRHSTPEITAEEVAGIADGGAGTPDYHRLADLLQSRLPDHQWEPVSDTGDTLIVNICDEDNSYIGTLTISRTPGC